MCIVRVTPGFSSSIGLPTDMENGLIYNVILTGICYFLLIHQESGFIYSPCNNPIHGFTKATLNIMVAQILARICFVFDS